MCALALKKKNRCGYSVCLLGNYQLRHEGGNVKLYDFNNKRIYKIMGPEIWRTNCAKDLLK